MSLTATIKNAVSNAFAALGDLTETITITLNPETGYEPVSDTSTVTGDVYTAQAVPYDEEDEKGLPRTRGKVFVLQASEVEIPAKSSGTVTHAAQTWQIHTVETDPTESVVILHCRQ